MATDLTTTEHQAPVPSAIPPKVAPDHRVAIVLSSLTNQIERIGDVDKSNRLPTAEERRMLVERGRDVNALLRPADHAVAEVDRIRSAVGAMLGGWIIRGINPVDTVDSFVLLLKSLPCWAVVAACIDFARGEATEIVDGEERKISPVYPPSAPQVRVLARRKLDDLYNEQARIKRVLALVPNQIAAVDDATKERIGAQFRELADALTGKSQALKAEELAEAQRKAAEARERAAKIAADKRQETLGRYRALGLRPVETAGGYLIDPLLLTDDQRVPAVEGGQDVG